MNADTNPAPTLAEHAATRQVPRRVPDNRLGITPNPAVAVCPPPKPRDVWRKWPRLHSTRIGRRQPQALHSTRSGSAPGIDSDLSALRAAVTKRPDPSPFVQKLLTGLRKLVGRLIAGRH